MFNLDNFIRAAEKYFMLSDNIASADRLNTYFFLPPLCPFPAAV